MSIPSGGVHHRVASALMIADAKSSGGRHQCAAR
jgi:hypothetical protein